MSLFTGNDFMYNNIISSKFNLKIAYLESDNIVEDKLSPTVSPILKALPNRSKVYHLGNKLDDDGVLKLPIEFYRENQQPIEKFELDVIADWLFNDLTFKQLKIIQDDMSTFYYNCFFTDVTAINIGGTVQGFKAIAVCDAPFAWKNPIVKEVHNTAVNNVYPDVTTIQLINGTSDHNLIIPQLIEIDLADNEHNVKVINTSNQNQYFSFNNLVVGDKIVMNDNLEMYLSNRPNTVIVDNFDGVPLKLVKGINILKIEGRIKRFKIKYQCSKKIG